MRLCRFTLLSSTSARTVLTASTLAGAVIFGTPALAQVHNTGDATTFNAGIAANNSSGVDDPFRIIASFNTTSPTAPLRILPIDLQTFTLGITNMSGAGGLNVYSGGAGVLSLTGTNLFAGGIQASSSTVAIDGGAALGAGTLNLNSATLRLLNNVSISNAISLTSLGATFDTAGFNATVSGPISGPSPLYLVGGGMLTLTNANTFAGGTTINSGGIIAKATGALGSGAVTVDGGTSSLAYDGAGVTAGSTAIILNNSSALTFSNGASAGLSNIVVSNDPTPGLGMGVFFEQNSSAGNATINNAYGGGYTTVTFRATSSAGTASIVNTGGAITSFENSSTAGNAQIFNSNGSVFFQNTTNAGTATFNNTNGTVDFSGSASAGSATIINGAAGRTYFSNNSSGGSARLINNAGGLLDISSLVPSGTTLGSIEGAGTFALGAKNLTVGSNNLNTTVSGTITGPTGSLTKTGAGTLTLTDASTYGGGTTIGNGTLEVQNAAALGTSLVRLAGGHLRSNIAGTTTLPNEIRFQPGQTSTLSAAPGQTLNIDFFASGTGSTIRFGTPADTGTIIVAGPSFAYSRHALEVNGGTLRAGSDQLSSHLNGAHTVTVARDATLDLATYDTRISGLQGDGTLISDAPRLRILSGTFGGTIAGSAALVKPWTGTLTLTGTSTLTGPTTVEGGLLVVNGSLASSPVSVSEDTTLNTKGTLGGTGTVGGLNVLSGGTAAPGNSIGTLSVNGNVAFGPGSFYAVEINGAGQSDRIAATGTATLNGGTVQVLPDQGINFVENTPYTILTAQGGVTGTFAGTQSAEFA
ncbi:beta strand repeat-containing protein, partial [Microvirga rosea]|uniref:beta strand repeat-containing protein n=1 Tax=Microvirga rosea TaxID=2715425 RepID=UPI001D0AEA1D